MQAGGTIVRVAAVGHDQLLHVGQSGAFHAKLAASFLRRNPTTRDLPCVDDRVCVEKRPSDDTGRIHSLLERRTVLRRKAAGDSVEPHRVRAT